MANLKEILTKHRERLDETDKSPSEWAHHFSSPTYKHWIKTLKKHHGNLVANGEQKSHNDISLSHSTHAGGKHAVTYASTHAGQKFVGNFHHTTGHGIVMGKDGNLAANILTE